MKAFCWVKPSCRTVRTPSTKSNPITITRIDPVTGRGIVSRTATTLGSRASAMSMAPMTYPARRAATPREGDERYGGRQIDDGRQRAGDAGKQYGKAADVEAPLNAAKVYGARYAPGDLLDRGRLVAGLYAHHNAHYKEHQKQRQKVLVQNRAEAGPSGELGEANPRGIERRPGVVHSKRYCNYAAHNDGYGNGEQPQDAGGSQHQDRGCGQRGRAHGRPRYRRRALWHVLQPADGYGHCGGGYHHEGHAGHHRRDDPFAAGPARRPGQTAPETRRLPGWTLRPARLPRRPARRPP